MAPFLPVVGISRSQSVRIGRSPNAAVVPQVSMGDTPGVNPQTGGFQVPAYVDLGDPQHRRDLEHHSAIGDLIAIGPLSQTLTSDLFFTAAPTLTNGVGALTVTVGAFTMKSRTYQNTIALNGGGKTITLAVNPTGSARTDLIVSDQAGNLSVIQGVASGAGAAASTPANKVAVGSVVVPANATLTTAPTSSSNAIAPTA